MTREEFITEVSERIKIEYNDAINYAKLSKAIDLEGPAQILDDIAHEEYHHAEHLEYILRELGALKEDNFGLKKNAQEMLCR